MLRESVTVPSGIDADRPGNSGAILGVSNAALPEGDHFAVTVHAGRHRLTTDETTERGGSGSGPTPVALLLASLASCTATTLRMYANWKYLDPGEISVRVRYHADEEQNTVGAGAFVEREISFTGSLTGEDLDGLTDIADRTPVTLIVRAAVPIRTTLRTSDKT